MPDFSRGYCLTFSLFLLASRTYLIGVVLLRAKQHALFGFKFRYGGPFFVNDFFCPQNVGLGAKPPSLPRSLSTPGPEAIILMSSQVNPISLFYKYVFVPLLAFEHWLSLRDAEPVRLLPPLQCPLFKAFFSVTPCARAPYFLSVSFNH